MAISGHRRIEAGAIGGLFVLLLCGCSQDEDNVRTPAMGRHSKSASPRWSVPSNGLSATLVFEVEASAKHASVIHPKIKLRNESSVPIKFLWCIYDAGTFTVRTRQGVPVQRAHPRRSGPVGPKVHFIQPGQVIELDAYDYGYGLDTDTRVFVFHTSSFQAVLSYGTYLSIQSKLSSIVNFSQRS